MPYTDGEPEWFDQILAGEFGGAIAVVGLAITLVFVLMGNVLGAIVVLVATGAVLLLAGRTSAPADTVEPAGDQADEKDGDTDDVAIDEPKGLDPDE